MRARCGCETHHKYKDYGAKGITVCRRWQESFPAFLTDMGRKPSPQHTVDRINGKRGYYPRNCRWATKREQNRNKKTNRVLLVRGESKCLAAWAEQVGVDMNTIHMRLKCGWSAEDAVFRPVAKKRRSGGSKENKNAS